MSVGDTVHQSVSGMVLRVVRWCFEDQVGVHGVGVEVSQGGVPGVSLENGGDSDRTQKGSDHAQEEEEEEEVVGLTRREEEDEDVEVEAVRLHHGQ